MQRTAEVVPECGPVADREGGPAAPAERGGCAAEPVVNTWVPALMTDRHLPLAPPARDRDKIHQSLASYPHTSEQRSSTAQLNPRLAHAATMPVQSRLATLASHLQSSTVSVGGRDYAVSHASGVTTYRCASSSGAVVAMLGAGGGIGQPISMLLKLSPLVSELRLYDVVRTLGVGADLGHIDSDVRRTRPARAAHARWSTETPACTPKPLLSSAKPGAAPRAAAASHPLRVESSPTGHAHGFRGHGEGAPALRPRGLRPRDHDRRRRSQARHDP